MEKLKFYCGGSSNYNPSARISYNYCIKLNTIYHSSSFILILKKTIFNL